MSLVRELHKKWMHEADYRQAYEELELARGITSARVAAGLTQKQLAQRMQTTQSVIARLEGGRSQPSMQTLKRVAKTTGTKLKISFEPAD